nr:unnamed protein product [Spirometra erinaceieuropaei]
MRQLHDGMMARVTDNGAIPKAFEVTNGVKQGCVLMSAIFSLMSSIMLMDAYRDERPEIRIAYRTGGQLLNHWRINSCLRASTTTVHELLFVDDCALNANTIGDMQRRMDLLSAACEIFVLIIITEKTVVIHQPPPDAAYVAPKISVNGAQLQVADNAFFTTTSWNSPLRLNQPCIWAAPPATAPKSMIKWPAGFPKPAKTLAVSKTLSETVTVSISTQN